MFPTEIPIPDGPLGLVFKHFWVAMLGTTLFKAWAAWTQKIRPKIKAMPELEDGYRRLVSGALLVTTVPLLLIGWGIMSGKVESVLHYIVLVGGENSMVRTFWLALAVLLAAVTLWMFTGGAEKLEEHPGISGVPESSAKRIKLLWLLQCIPFGLIAFVTLRGVPIRIQDPTAATKWLELVFPLAFPALWVTVTFILGQMSGWAGLGGKFGATERYRGPTISTSGKMGITSYGGVITMGANNHALHLRVPLPFRPGHPPLCIPWSAIEVSTRKGFLIHYVCLKLDTVMLEVRKKDVLKLGKRHQLPPALAQLGD